jgi:hypothetical protein
MRTIESLRDNAMLFGLFLPSFSWIREARFNSEALVPYKQSEMWM